MDPIPLVNIRSTDITNSFTGCTFSVLRRGAVMIILMMLAAVHTTLFAQNISKNGISQISAAIDSFRDTHPIEKLYLQFDKPYYAIGDTMWFKAYLLNGAYLRPSDKSGIFYIDLLNDSGKVVKRTMHPVVNGLSWGNIALAAADFSSGNYTLRAYTKWMCNFNGDHIFNRNFYFFDALANDLLVDRRISLSTDSGTEKAHINLHITNLNGELARLKTMELDVDDGRRTLHKETVQTKLDGSLSVDMAIRSSPKHLFLKLLYKDAGAQDKSLLVPVSFSRPQNTDVQFMPEGGYLVAGLPAYAGFKAMGEDGAPAAIEGMIYDSRQQPIIGFKSAHNGMGAFNFTPQPGESYTANIKLPGGTTKTYALPAIKMAGTVLKVRKVTAADSIAITVTGTQNGAQYYLLGQARGIVCYAVLVTLVNNAAKVKVSTGLFPSGVARFTLMDANKQPLNERIVFIDHHDNLRISVTPDRPAYGPRDSVTLKVKVTGPNGLPVKGSFSVAVTSVKQVKPDSINCNNMATELLLTSDLRGNVNDPGYYLQAGAQVEQQLDDLLLTQGWVGYAWRDILGPSRPVAYSAERDFAVTGHATNLFKKPAMNARVTLLSKKPAFVLDTLTDKAGRFEFTGMAPIDTPIYFLQARNKSGRSFNIGLTVDEFKPPQFNTDRAITMPWYVNSDTTMLNFIKANKTRSEGQEKINAKGHLLKEVVISSKKLIKGSQNPNGPGNADIVIDEEELEKAGKKTWLDLLQEKVKGFKEGTLAVIPPPEYFSRSAEHRVLAAFLVDDSTILRKPQTFWATFQDWYFIGDRPIKFIIDGIPVYQVMPMSYPALYNIRDYLASHSAEDIKGIEVMRSSKYAMQYIPSAWAVLGVTMSNMAFVEITTRSGSGPGIYNTPGTFLYKPLPFSVAKQFYSPKYNSARTDTASDRRSTVFWQPDLNTDRRGQASVSFYTTDEKGNYTVIVQGTDRMGNVGSGKAVIKVGNK